LSGTPRSERGRSARPTACRPLPRSRLQVSFSPVSFLIVLPRLTLRPARDRGPWLPARCVRPPLSFVGPQWVCPYRYAPSFLPAIAARWVPGGGRDGRGAAISGNRGEPSDSVGGGEHFEER